MKIAIYLIVQLVVVSSFADTFANCKIEIKKFKCSGDDKAVYECLEKNSKDLSAKCEANHEAYEKKNHITPAG